MKFTKLRKKIINPTLKYLLVFLILGFIVSLTWDVPSKNDLVQKETRVEPPESRPWYFNGGSIRPERHDRSIELWPSEAEGDRIVNQLMYIPRTHSKSKVKIFVEKLQEFVVKKGSEIFEELDCPVKTCEIVDNATNADAVIFEDYITRFREKSTLNQIWILSLLESPFYSGKVIQQTSVNWTASYRLDSDLVTPYDKWAYYNKSVRVGELQRNYSEGRTKQIAWFVSNCHSRNKRLQYAKALQKYISVDIYGECGDHKCSKTQDEYCKEKISQNYKFYLSFENANCRDYITEKFYLNALRYDLIPIVMGAPREDYEKVAPLNSFIHVEDFSSPKELADYLHFLDKNDEAYNSYFLWKSTGEFINTYFMCRLCATLHADRDNYNYNKIMEWWRNSGTCTKKFWNKKNSDKILKSLKSDLNSAYS